MRPEFKYGVIELHSNEALRERFYDVVQDLRAAACIVDLWVMDIAAVLREHGYEMTIKRVEPEVEKIPCHCHCPLSRQLCVDKNRCYVSWACGPDTDTAGKSV